MPAFAFWILPGLRLHLLDEVHASVQAKGASKVLEIDLSSMTAVASHVEVHLWIIEESSAIRPECIICGSGCEVVDPSIP